MTDTLLKIENLAASYGERNVFTDISFQIQKGETFCIVGESGSGKSTLLKTICGVEGLSATSGKIFFNGKDILCEKPKERRKHLGREIGIVMQNPGAFFNPLRRFDVQFKEMLKAHGFKYEENKIISIFTNVGLPDAKDILRSRPYEMSGGMNQRIAIAAVMLLNPSLLLCDEATSALDVTTARMIVELLLQYRKEKNIGILMVTHNLGIAQMMADKVAIMKRGSMIEYGNCDEIFSSPKHEYTKKLIAGVPVLCK